MHRVRDAVRALSYIVCMHVFVNRSLAYLLEARAGVFAWHGMVTGRSKDESSTWGSRPGTLIKNYLVALSTSVSTSALSPFDISPDPYQDPYPRNNVEGV
ncbi:uncharacterized protein RCO7_14059 [Rhynchosporium graminicola]|uniref:Uncharacterized protein n=1 Tax=Rhynchosporium graminicola TaxID=2792576 RepID=A0A1E1LIG8_9HELO|nr:uncharacterized protein RCO7_14059 [Rhynchosporium commune]